MSDVETAVSRFREGFSCSQAMLLTYGERLGVNHELAARIASGFGGGLGRMGQTCGAVTGVLMVLGLRCGGTKPGDGQAKAGIAKVVQEFIAKFEAREGSSECRELLGCEIDTPEKAAAVKEKGLFATVCAKAVKDAAEILEGMLAGSER